MPRKRDIPKKKIIPDPIYNSTVVYSIYKYDYAGWKKKNS
jgi:hypothetical protein